MDAKHAKEKGIGTGKHSQVSTEETQHRPDEVGRFEDEPPNPGGDGRAKQMTGHPRVLAIRSAHDIPKKQERQRTQNEDGRGCLVNEILRRLRHFCVIQSAFIVYYYCTIII